MLRFLKKIFILPILNLFDTMTTATPELSAEMKTYYHDRLIDNAEPELIHDQFAQKVDIPKNGGKTVEFRRYSPLAKALTPLTEGITPAGNKLEVTTLTATVDQYGDYITFSDMLEMTAIDKNIDQGSILLGNQAGCTLDTVTREVMQGGTNKMFAPLVAADGTLTEILLRADITTASKLSVEVIKKAVAKLKRMKAAKIDGSYVAIIHTDTSCDIQKDPSFIDITKYKNPEKLYEGEIGKIGGARFIETTEAKIIAPSKMLGITGYLRTTVKDAVNNSKDVYPVDPFSVAQAGVITTAIAGGTAYKLYVDGTERTVEAVTGGAAGVCKITLTVAVTVAAGKVICGTGAGKDGSAIYCTLFLGSNAYGVTEISGMGLEHIVKPKGSAGTADPLNQRSSVGWKATKVAERLVEEYMLRVEHSSETFGATAEAN